jgi:gluconate kinase
MNGAHHALAGWTPIEVRGADAAPVVRWCFTEGIAFTDPFFRQSIDRCLADPFRLLFWRHTGIDALAELAASSPGLEPSGFIFHLSRCGSTLVTQMFAALEDTLVLSEPDPLDPLLRAQTVGPTISDDDVATWLRWMISALGQRRRSDQERLVVKLDAWAIFLWPLIRRAFPDTPCVFVYRDPIEVMVSQLGHRGYHMVPGTLPLAWFGFTADDLASANAEQFCAAVLAGMCGAALSAAEDRYLSLIHYSSLPAAVPDVIAPLFGFDIGPSERAAFARAASRDAKNPILSFASDSADKQRRATPAVRAAVAGSVGPAYAALESLRLGCG